MHLRNALVVSGLLTAAALAAPSAQKPRSQWDGVFTAAQAKSGAALYAKHCANCHGDTLGGGGFGPSLLGSTFWANWNGVTLDELVDRIRNTMPQDNPGSLSRAQSTEVAVFMLEKNGAPAGKEALVPQPAALEQITLQATK